MAAPIAHSDEVEPEFRGTEAPMGGAWFDLGTAAGSDTVGVSRATVDPGMQSSPLHAEGAEEEIFWVLSGSGLSVQAEACHEVAAGDCLVHRVQELHTLVAGPEGIDVLAFGMRTHTPATLLPRAGVLRLHDTWLELTGGDHPWEREGAAGPVPMTEPAPRPASIVHVDAVEAQTMQRGDVHRTRRDLGRTAGSHLTGLQHVVVEPGAHATVPHCHSAEEELFVVLDGDGTLLLGEGAGQDEEHPVRPGSVVARRAGTGVAHRLRAGDGGLTMLAYGTRDPRDICFYPRSNKLAFRGVGVIARIERLEYWDGEE